MRARSFGAVIAGALVVIVVTTIVDVVLHISGFYPPMGQAISDTQAIVATAYRAVFGILGGWVTARIAPDRPMKHALALGYVGVALGLIGLAVTWNKGFGPRWYPIALVVLAIPEALIGAKIYEARARAPGVGEA